MEITYAPETMLLGTGGPLRGLRGFFGSEPFVVANSDTVMDLDLRAMIDFHRSSGALATFALCRPADMSPYSQLEIDADGRLRRVRLLTGGPGGGFEDFPAAPPAEAVEPYMFCGLYICAPQVYDLMPRGAAVQQHEGYLRPDGRARDAAVRLRASGPVPHRRRPRYVRESEAGIRGESPSD